MIDLYMERWSENFENISKELCEKYSINLVSVTAFGMDTVASQLKSGTLRLPTICLVSNYDYVVDIVKSEFKTVASDDNESNTNRFDFTNSMPVEIDMTMTILTTDISQMIEIENFVLDQYKSPVQLLVKCPNMKNQMIPIRISVNESATIDRKSGSTDKYPTIYQSMIEFKNDKECVSFVQSYHPAKLEFDKEVHADILKRLVALSQWEAIFNKEMLQGNSNAKNKLCTIKSAQKELCEWIHIPSRYENAEDIEKLYKILSDSCCDIKTAIGKLDKEKETEKRVETERLEKIAKEAEKEKERIQRINKQFSKTGDKVINRFTDAVIAEIKSKLENELDIPIFGGSTYLEWYRLKELDELAFPNILVNTNSNFTFAYKKYTNISTDDVEVAHDFTQNALPIDFGISIVVNALDRYESKKIAEKIIPLYANEITISIPDPIFNNELCPIKLLIDPDSSISTEKNVDSSKTTIVFKKHLSVYYPIDYSLFDVSDNQCLQFRLLQQAEFLLLCDSSLRKALKDIDLYYKPLFKQNEKKSFWGTFKSVVGDAVGSVVYSQEYNQLKMCFKNGTPIDKALFDKALKDITDFYPYLYEKMVQGWSIEQIQNDLNRYISFFNERWNSICNNLAAGACMKIFPQLGMSGNKNQPLETIRQGLAFYMEKMVNDPYCTLSDVQRLYAEHLQAKKEEEERLQQVADEVWDSMKEARRERQSGGDSSAGFLGNMFSTAGGVAIGNKMSGNNNRKDGKKDLFGTYVCKRCNPKGSDNRFTCIGCPAIDRCTQQYR